MGMPNSQNFFVSIRPLHLRQTLAETRTNLICRQPDKYSSHPSTLESLDYLENVPDE